MRAPAVLFLVVLGCTATPTAVPSAHRASIEFVERPGGILKWDFAVHGLPATDIDSGALIIADIGHGHIASSLSLDLYSMPGRKVAVLDSSEAGHVMYDLDESPEAVGALARDVRGKTEQANRMLAGMKLRPATTCTVAKLMPCAHPQKIVCGDETFTLDGDTLTSARGGGGAKKLGWSVAPMTIGDGPPKEMITCVSAAVFDPDTKKLATHVETSCKGGGSDACYLPEEWRLLLLL